MKSNWTKLTFGVKRILHFGKVEDKYKLHALRNAQTSNLVDCQQKELEVGILQEFIV